MAGFAWTTAAFLQTSTRKHRAGNTAAISTNTDPFRTFLSIRTNDCCARTDSLDANSTSRAGIKVVTRLVRLGGIGRANAVLADLAGVAQNGWTRHTGASLAGVGNRAKVAVVAGGVVRQRQTGAHVAVLALVTILIAVAAAIGTRFALTSTADIGRIRTFFEEITRSVGDRSTRAGAIADRADRTVVVRIETVEDIDAGAGSIANLTETARCVDGDGLVLGTGSTLSGAELGDVTVTGGGPTFNRVRFEGIGGTELATAIAEGGEIAIVLRGPAFKGIGLHLVSRTGLVDPVAILGKIALTLLRSAEKTIGSGSRATNCAALADTDLAGGVLRQIGAIPEGIRSHFNCRTRSADAGTAGVARVTFVSRGDPAGVRRRIADTNVAGFVEKRAIAIATAFAGRTIDTEGIAVAFAAIGCFIRTTGFGVGRRTDESRFATESTVETRPIATPDEVATRLAGFAARPVGIDIAELLDWAALFFGDAFGPSGAAFTIAALRGAITAIETTGQFRRTAEIGVSRARAASRRATDIAAGAGEGTSVTTGTVVAAGTTVAAG